MSPHRLKIFLISFCFVNKVFSYLDVGELNSFQYSIDISDKPVLIDKSKEKEGILLSSRQGQKYQCLFESVSQFSLKEEEDTASKSSVPDLLKPLENQPCLILTTGWWTYEFCYKKHVRQYHVLDQKIDGDVLVLGKYADEFDWGAAGDKKTPEKSNRYHSQRYVNGSLCDLTGVTRSAEIRFRCKEDNSDILEGVEEPVTCSYVLHVSTPRLCKHPSLRPVPKKHSLPVTCSPVLGDKDYKKYLKLQKKLEESKISDGKAEKDGALQGKSSSTEDGGTVVVEGGGEASILEFGDSRIKFYVLSHDGMKPLDEFLKESKSEDDGPPRPDATEEEEKNKNDAASVTAVSDDPSPSSTDAVQSNADETSLKIDGGDAADKVSAGSSGDNDVSGDNDDDDLFNVFNKFLSNRRLKSFLNRKGKTATAGAGEESAAAATSADANEGGEGAGGEDVGSLAESDESGGGAKREALEKMGSKDDGGDDDDDDGNSKKKRDQVETDYKANEVSDKDGRPPADIDYVTVKDDQEKTTITWKGENENFQLSEGVRITIKGKGEREGEGEGDSGHESSDGVLNTGSGKKTITEDKQDAEGKTDSDEVVIRIVGDGDDPGDDAIKKADGEDGIDKDLNLEGEGSKKAVVENGVKSLEKVGAQMLDNFFKKGGRKLQIEDQKTVQMILAIVRQPDRDTKEAARHEKIEKNYNFNWNEHRKEAMSALREKERESNNKNNAEVVVVVENKADGGDDSDSGRGGHDSDGGHVMKFEGREDL